MKELRELLNVPNDHVECRKCYGSGASIAAIRHLGDGVVNPERGEPCTRCGGMGFHAPEQPKAMSSAEREAVISLALHDALSAAVTLKLKGVPLAEKRIQTARDALLAHGRTEAEVSEMVAQIEDGWKAGKQRQWTPEGQPITEREVEALR